MGAIESLEAEFWAIRDGPQFYRSLEFAESGIMLGAGVSLVPLRRGVEKSLDPSGEDRAFVLLAAALGRPVQPGLLAKLNRAAELWEQGETSLAHIHLAQLGLPKLETEEQSSAFFSPTA